MVVAPVRTDASALNREYVAGGTHAFSSATLAALPHPIDDITRDFGVDIYDSMAHDPQVSACISVFKASILEEGGRLDSVIKDDDDKDYDLAKEITDEATSMLAELDTSIDDVLWNLLDCIVYGNKVAEQVCGYTGSVKDGSAIHNLIRLKVKPPEATIFVVDAYMNLIGLLAARPGEWAPVQGQMGIFAAPENLTKIPNLISPEKFAIATFRSNNSDPRGTSLIRSSYSPWWRKQQVIPEYLRYLSQFAGPSLIGTVGPSAMPSVDANGVTTSAEQKMLNALLSMQNGSAAAFPAGSTVKEIAMQGNGEAFVRALHDSDQQITKAILTQELATEQGEHQTRAAASVHQDVLDTLVRQAKRSIVGMMRRQVLRPWVRRNWGDKAVRFTPSFTLGETEQRDLASLWQAAAALANANYLHESQLQDLDRQIGLPQRDEAAFPTTMPTGSGATPAKPTVTPVPNKSTPALPAPAQRSAA